MDSIEKLCAQTQEMQVEITHQSLYQPKVKLLSGRDRFGDGAVSIDDRKRLPISYVNAGLAGPMPLLKTALTTVCENNCKYCSFSTYRDGPRQTFTPDELAAVFMAVYNKGYVKGFFLSSGIVGGGIRTQDQLIAAGEILRNRYGFRGYLHMKIMPGAERSQVLRAMQLANRVSINLEAPTVEALKQIAPSKPLLPALDERLLWINQIRETLPACQGWQGKWPSSSTQFVVGGGESTNDRAYLALTENLHRRKKLARVYFSGFNPVSGTPLASQLKQEPLRVLRLYQSAFLIRDYGYDAGELVFFEDGFLDIHKDPKVSLAERMFADQPLEINRAAYEQLIRIPGIGPRTAKGILEARRHRMIYDTAGLKKLGVNVERALPYVLMNGKQAERQLFFSFYQ
jgi:predicted DNA-binding helix-hairpin-helix protein